MSESSIIVQVFHTQKTPNGWVVSFNLYIGGDFCGSLSMGQQRFRLFCDQLGLRSAGKRPAPIGYGAAAK